MFRKSYILAAFIIAIISIGSTSVFGQTAITSGRVEVEKADGTREGVADAVIDVYRTDAKAGFPKGKTDKKGNFTFAGFMIGGVYMLSVSAPNCSPTVFPNVKAGQEKLLVTMRPGDGKKYTEAEARAILAGAKTAGPASDGTPDTSAADKAALEKEKADYEAKVAEVNAKNKKAAENYDKINLLLKEGSEAVKLKNYDIAIAKYEEGIAIEPNFIGSTPVLLNNRGTSLRLRAVETYNKSVKLTDTTAKVEGYGKARKDILDAADSHMRAWKMTSEAPASEIKDPAFNDGNKLNALKEGKEAFRIAVATEQVEPAVIEAAKVLIPQYVAVETDAAKKSEAMLIMADLYRVTADSQNAIDAYKKILEATPDNVDALSGVGFSLVNLGFINNDKALMQEGANYLARFVSSAPDTNKFKGDAVALIDNLKKEQNVTATKPSSGGKKKP